MKDTHAEALQAINQRITSKSHKKSTKRKTKECIAMEDAGNDVDGSFSSKSTDSTVSTSTSTFNKIRSTKKTQRKKPKKGSKKQKKNKSPEKQVAFGTIQILEFTYTIGRQSVTEKGPPVALSSQLVRTQDHDVDSYELQKAKEKVTMDVELSAETRIQILLDQGYNMSAIMRADEESKRVRVYRKQSVLEMHRDDWNERKERVHRRLQRWTNPKNLYSKGSTLWQRSTTSGQAILSY
jgi:hypothetical protein